MEYNYSIILIFSAGLGIGLAVAIFGLAVQRRSWSAAVAREHQLTAAAKRAQRLILDASPALIWWKNTANRILFVNRAAAEASGRTSAEIEGRSSAEIYPVDSERYFADDLEVVASQREKRGIIEPFTTASGEQRWVRTDKVPHFNADDKKVDGIIVFSHDITDLKRTELKLAEALAEAERASRAKTDFMSVVSHEIRTPLGVILGFSELMMTSTLTDAAQRGYVEKVLRNAKRLQKLIDDILDVARIERGHFTTETTSFELRPLLADLESTFRPRAAAKGLTLEIKVGAEARDHLTSDPNRMRQILSNVIDNAIKFTREGGVTLTVADRDGALTFVVRDTGPGIPAARTAELFQPFSQLDAGDRRHGGLGLGLSLSRRLAEALGGSLTLLASEVGVGSAFALTFDWTNFAESKAAPRVAEVPERQGHPIFAGKTMLLVEDHRDIQEMIRRFLEQTGVSLMIAGDGKEGIATALQHRPDLILMDLELPEINGMKATMTLRAQGFDAPIVAMSAHAMKGQHEACLAAGFTDFLAKPVMRDELFQRLARALGAS